MPHVYNTTPRDGDQEGVRVTITTFREASHGYPVAPRTSVLSWHKCNLSNDQRKPGLAPVIST